MTLIAAIGFDFDGQHPFLSHVDIVEIEIDAQKPHIFATLDLHRLRIAGILLHVLIVQVNDVGTIGRITETLKVQDVQCVAMSHVDGQVLIVAGRTGNDNGQVIVRDALTVGQRAIIVMAGIGYIDSRHTIIVERSLEADVLFILLVLPFVVATGTESTEKTEDTERRVILEGPGSLESLESQGGPKAVLIPKTPEIPETIARAENQVYECVEEMPSFPGGMKALEKFLNDSIRYPAETCAQGRVIVQFIVEVDGRIDSVKVVRKLSPELDREAVRVVKLMPKWNPGRQNGVPVRVKYIIPVRFNAKQ